MTVRTILRMLLRRRCQLSYNHIAPYPSALVSTQELYVGVRERGLTMTIMHRNEPNRAPINPTRPLKMGMALRTVSFDPVTCLKGEDRGTDLAMMYARRVHPRVHDNQTTQCVTVLEVKCRLPFRTRKKMYLAGSYLISSALH